MTDKIKYLKWTGIFLLITGTPLVVYRSPPAHKFTTSNILGELMLFGGAFLYWRSRQYAAKAVANKITSDSKPHVLYLRSFATDPSFGTTAAGIFSGWLTPEEQLDEALQPFGEFVAIGKPGDTLPTPGAARLYASDAEWKKTVTDQIQTARLIVIRAGTSGGLLWELQEAIHIVNPKKLLILILEMGKNDYESFTKEADQIFNATFPRFHDLKRFGTISGFVRFSSDWSPKFLPLRAPFFSVFYKPNRALFTFTLRPVFEEYGLEWKPPPRVSNLMFWSGFLLFIFVMSFIQTCNRKPTFKVGPNVSLDELQQGDDVTLRVTDALAITRTNRTRSHAALIRVYDEAGNVIETHDHKGDFKEP
jgi:hypothetical protein